MNSSNIYQDEVSAQRVITFFEKFLRHSKGQFAHRPFTLLPWQESLISLIYGQRRTKDNLRKIRRVYVEIPKKNGKSTLCAGLGLYGLVGDKEPGAEVYIVATSRENASTIYNECCTMVKACPALAKILTLIPSQKKILYPKGNGLLKVLSTEHATVEGVNASLVICDELHAWNDSKLWDALLFSGASRTQPLHISITTAGSEKAGICWREHEYAKKVIAKEIDDPSYLPLIYGADDSDDWTRLETFSKANPSYGVTLFESEVEQSIARAKLSPTEEYAYKRYRLNLWQDANSIDWLPVSKWDDCLGTVDIPEGSQVWAGLDLSTSTDLSALVVLYHDGERFIVKPYFWAPAEACRKRERLNKQKIDQWARDGLIELCEGEVIDYDVIRRRINEYLKPYNVQALAVDPWNATQLSTQLDGDGLPVMSFDCNCRNLNEPMKYLERLILSKQIVHDGNPVARWMFSNLQIFTDIQGNIRPNKKTSRDHIDFVLALAMCLGSFITDRPSLYERGTVFSEQES